MYVTVVMKKKREIMIEYLLFLLITGLLAYLLIIWLDK